MAGREGVPPASFPLEVRDGAIEKRKISLRQIEVFRAVMISGSINGASQILRVSQPSLSRVVKRTEDILGFTLFERAKGRLIPTKEAGALLDMVRRVYQQLDELGETVERLTRGDDGLFRFGTTGSAGRCLVPAALARLSRDLPRLAYQVDVLVLGQLIDYLQYQRGECVVSVFPIRHPLVRTKALAEGDLLAVVPRGHRLADRELLLPEDMAGERLISFAADTPHAAAVSELFRSARLVPRVGVWIRCVETAIALVAKGIGIAIVDEFAVADATAFPISVIPVAGGPRLHIYLSWHRDLIRSQFFERFEDALVGALQAGRPSAPHYAPRA
ncbi:MAG TPA: LysR family transcriptional regulator [Stellaceae bacterium]|nr:LysR family transcriptional regulator [Stellaceae bacterium]